MKARNFIKSPSQKLDRVRIWGWKEVWGESGRAEVVPRVFYTVTYVVPYFLLFTCISVQINDSCR